MSPRLPERTPPVLLAALSALVAGLAVAVVLMALSVRDSTSLAAAHDAAVRAARQEALNLTSVDSRDLAGSLARVVAGATGAFRADLVAREATLQQIVPANKVLAQGMVVEAALVRGDRDTATVIVAVDATIKNIKVPQGRTNPYRMQLDLQRHGNRWLTSALQFVG